MKTILFISANKILGQGLSAAIMSKPGIGFQWKAQFNYAQAVVGADIFHADMVILDVVDQTDMENATEICQSLRQTIFYKGIMPSEKVLDFPVDCNTLTGSVNL